MVRAGTDEVDEPWLLTWLPDSTQDPSYPGFTISPESVDFPTSNGIGGVLEWAARQTWTRRAAGEDVEEAPAPAEATSLGVPADEFATFSEKVHMDFGWFFAATKEPDGSFSWAVMSRDGYQVKSGVADTWDDARLAAIEDLYPPSGEE